MKIPLPNLPGKSRHFSQEECEKGGKSQSVWRTLSQSLAKRKKCSPTCIFFDVCPVSAMSLGFTSKNPEENQKCMMKEFPLTVRQQFISMFLTGEEGMIKAIKDALQMYMMEVDARGSLRDKRDMIDLMLRFYNDVYVKPKSIRGEQLREPLTIVIRRVGMEAETIDIKPIERLPEGVRLKDIVENGNMLVPEDDKESLFNSPKLEEILDDSGRNQ